jgi:peptide/nickel transport system substrate-binding protein
VLTFPPARIDPLPYQHVVLRNAISRRQALGGAGVGALALLIAACGGGQKGDGTSGAATTAESVAAGGGTEVDVVNWGLSSDIVGFDPAQAWDYATSPVIIQSLDTLVRLGQNGVSVEPNIATSWKQETSTRYVYTIRDGVKFHDGTALTAEDVAYSLNRHLDPNVGSLLSTFFVNVGKIAANGNVVTVDLKKPDALWKYVPTFTPGAVASKANIEATLKAGKKPGTPETPVIGSGPFKFVSWTRGQSVELERFDDYWNRDRPLKVKKLVFKPVADSDTMASALLSGDLQGTFQLDGRATKPLANNPDVQVVSGPSLNFRYLGFNVSKAPFDDPKVRQALSLALDKQGILDSAYGGQGKLWNSTILEQQWLFAPDVFKRGYDALTGYGRDLNQAKALIAEAGASGKGGTLVVSSTEEQAVGVAVQAAAESIGLKLEIQKVTGDQQSQLLNTDGPQRDYNAFVYNFGLDVPDPSEAIDISFLSTNPISNYSVYRDPATDELLNAQAITEDGPQRADLLTKAQARIGDQHVWIPLYQINTLLVLSSKLGGYQIKPLWYWDSWAADLSGT